MAANNKRDGSGEMKNKVQKQYLQRLRKKKQDRMRKLMKRKLVKSLSPAEEKELKQLQAELSS